MRQILILFVFVLFGLTACQQSESNTNTEPVEIPTVVSPAATIQPTPTPSLPPTWTPSAVNINSGSSGGETAVNGNAPVQESGTVYTVKPGDSLGEIAKTYNVSLQELADINNIVNWNIIEVGDVLIIPE